MPNFGQIERHMHTQADKNIRMVDCGLSTIIEHMYEIYSQVQKSIETVNILVAQKSICKITSVARARRAFTCTFDARAFVN